MIKLYGHSQRRLKSKLAFDKYWNENGIEPDEAKVILYGRSVAIRRRFHREKRGQYDKKYKR